MFYISKDFGDNTYGVTDSKDMIEERYSMDDIMALPKSVSIQGVSRKFNRVTRVYQDMKDVIDSCIVRLKLTNPGINIDYTDNRVRLVSVDKGIKNFKVPDFVTELYSFCFKDCEYLQSISIPDSVTKIGSACFRGCSSLQSINIPDSVTELSSQCFFDCKSLQSISIPDSVTEIGKCCFYGCNLLTVVVTPGSYAEDYCKQNGVRYRIKEEV